MSEIVRQWLIRMESKVRLDMMIWPGHWIVGTERAPHPLETLL